jgi:hypothetical protein
MTEMMWFPFLDHGGAFQLVRWCFGLFVFLNIFNCLRGFFCWFMEILFWVFGVLMIV